MNGFNDVWQIVLMSIPRPTRSDSATNTQNDKDSIRCSTTGSQNAISFWLANINDDDDDDDVGTLQHIQCVYTTQSAANLFDSLQYEEKKYSQNIRNTIIKPSN